MSAPDERPGGRYLPPLVEDLIAEAPPMPPPREITPEEGAELIRRLNAPRGDRLVLDVDQAHYISDQPPIRSPEAVAELERRLREEPGDGDFYRAICETLDFAFGRTPTGPLSGEPPKHTPPTCGDLYHEEAVALRYINRETLHTESPLRRSQDFAVGVEHTCMYLQCRTDDPPWGDPPEHLNM